MAFVQANSKEQLKRGSFQSVSTNMSDFMKPTTINREEHNSFYQDKRTKTSDLNIFRPSQVDNKLFIGGITNWLSESDVILAFSEFGNVCSFKIFIDQFTGKRRGFGFLIFQNKVSFDLAVKQKFITIKGSTLECKASTPKQKATNAHKSAGFSSKVITPVGNTYVEKPKLFTNYEMKNVSQAQYFYYFGSGTNCFLEEFNLTIQQMNLEVPI